MHNFIMSPLMKKALILFSIFFLCNDYIIFDKASTHYSFHVPTISSLLSF